MTNPLKIDPSRTLTIRKKFISEINRRFREIKGKINRLIIDEDEFGLTDLVRNVQAWQFQTNPQKLQSYKDWLKDQVNAGILETDPTGEPWANTYVSSAYKKGVIRGYTDTKKVQLAQSPDFYEGTKAEFLQSAFAAPEAVQKLQLLQLRAFDQLKGITASMDQQMSRVLADGLAAGRNPRDIARELNKTVSGLTKSRARTIARTEVIHAHAEGQLDSFERLGVEEVGIQAEWSTAGDDLVCPLCFPLEGTIYTVKEARGMIPRHPNCVLGDSRIVSPDATGLLKTHYTGQIFEFVTAKGRKVSVTANHILLTNRGFVSAKNINNADYLVEAFGSDLGIENPYINGNVPTIEDCFCSVVESGGMSSVSVPLAPEDLHNEGSSTNGKVNVVFSNSFLRNEIQLGLCKNEKLLFQFGELGKIKGLLTRDGSLSEFFRSTANAFDSEMRRFGISTVFGGRSLLHHKAISGDLIPDSDPLINQAAVYGPTGTTKLLGESVDADAFVVELDDLGCVKFQCDKITGIRIVHVSNTPVYDLSTTSTMYSVNGLLSSNCRCAWIPANVGEPTKEWTVVDINDKDKALVKKTQVRTKSGIQQAILRSAKAEKPKADDALEASRWAGAKQKIKAKKKTPLVVKPKALKTPKPKPKPEPKKAAVTETRKTKELKAQLKEQQEKTALAKVQKEAAEAKVLQAEREAFELSPTGEAMKSLGLRIRWKDGTAELTDRTWRSLLRARGIRETSDDLFLSVLRSDFKTEVERASNLGSGMFKKSFGSQYSDIIGEEVVKVMERRATVALKDRAKNAAVPEIKRWKKANTKRQVKKQLEALPGIHKVDILGWSMDELNEIGADLTRMLSESPKLAKMAEMNSGVNQVRGSLDIILNKPHTKRSGDRFLGQYLDTKWHRKPGESPAIDLVSGGGYSADGALDVGTGKWHVSYNSYNSTARHEYGHWVQYVFDEDLGETSGVLLKRDHLDAIGFKPKQTWSKVLNSVGKQEDGDWMYAVSEYGSKNEREMFAESFAAWTHKDYGLPEYKRLPLVIEEYLSELTGKSIPK